MNAPFQEVKKILICPRSGNPLIQEGDLFTSHSNGSKELSIYYRTVRGQPVLVDFENSILDETEVFLRNGDSVLTRKQNRVRRWIKRKLLNPDANRLSGEVASVVIENLKAKVKNPKLLIIGGGARGIGTDCFYDDSEIQVVSFDIYASPLTHFIADAHKIPLAAESVDGVWIQYVLEHVLEPWTVINEIKRVLKGDGLVFAETPFLQQVHEGPYDFVRFTHSGHRWLFRDFHEIKSGISMGSGIQLLWTLEHNTRGVFRSKALGKLAKLLLFWLRLLEKVIPIRYAYDNASSFYFFGFKAAKPLMPKDIVSYYRGAS